MVSKFWKWGTLYLVIGVFWSAFWMTVAQEPLHVRYVRGERWMIPTTVVLSAFAWPVSMPTGLYVLYKERK